MIGAYLLVISALLTLAIDQAVLLIRLYRVSASPGPVTDFSSLRRLSFGSDLLILAVVAAILFLLVYRHHRKLLPVTFMAVLLFVALNLYSGRHLLLQLLIWPTPASLAEQYTQALAANDLEAALRLTDQTEACKTIMAQVFQVHRAQLQPWLADDRAEVSIQDVSVKGVATFYDKPIPQGFVMMQPGPSQLVTVVAEMENDQTFWLNLKMRYTPFWGTRFICGQDID